AQWVVGAVGLLLAEPGTQAQEQRRRQPRIARHCAIGAKPQSGTADAGARTARDGAAQLATGSIVGLLGRTIEAVLDLQPVRLELLRRRLPWHPHNGADGKAQARMG